MIAVAADPEATKHAEILARWLRAAPTPPPTPEPPSVVEWAEQNFWIPSDNGRPRLIRLMPHQKVILRLFFDTAPAEAFGCGPNFQTLVYSTVKKSGKTAVAAMVARWIAETWGSHTEVYCMANDLEQARGRIYQAALTSIEEDPRYARADKGIAGMWRIIERQALHIPTHSTIKAVSADYKGEAGSNPVASLWSELWGFSSEAGQRLWEELTPVPTRPRSIRYVETYAGYEGESSILNDLEDRVKKEGRRLTRDELIPLGLSWPFPPSQPLPFFVHTPSRTFAYWDEGEDARRMPWQTPQYYVAQQSDLRPTAYERLHLNKRVSATDEFIQAEWWDRLVTPEAAKPPGRNEPLIIGADAGVTGDCTGLVAVSRDPKAPDNVLQRLSRVWYPPPGKALDYSLTIEPVLRQWCTGHIHPLTEQCDTHSKVDVLGKCVPTQPYNVVQVAYDQYQLHDLMTRIRNEAVAWCHPFSQMGDRMTADKALFDMIRDQRIHHTGDADLREHILNAGAKVPADDNTRLRLVKKSNKAKIDLAVCLSMASYECLRLNL
jgi:phage terminase large subunit-like protein